MSSQRSKNLPAERDVSKLGEIVSIKYVNQRPYVTISEKFGSYSLPICLSPGLGVADLERVKTGGLCLSPAQTYLGESVFFLCPNSVQSLNCLDKIIESIKLSTASSWISQGNKINEDEYVKLGDKVYNKSQCYLRALSLTPDHSLAWYNLGCTLIGTQESVRVQGKTYSATACSIKAISLYKTWDLAWYQLGHNLYASQQDKALVNGRLVGEKECYIMAIELNPKRSFPWCSLGVALNKDETIIISGRRYTQHECFIKAVTLDSRDAESWSRVGKTLPESQTHVLVNDELHTRLQCQLQAIALNKNCALPWNFLGEILNNKDAIDLNGETLNSRQCYIKALEINVNFSSAWNNLGAALLPGEEMVVNGVTVSERDCYINALHLDNNNADAQRNLWFGSSIQS